MDAIVASNPTDLPGSSSYVAAHVVAGQKKLFGKSALLLINFVVLDFDQIFRLGSLEIYF